MRKTNKRGFTIVELVIVIAVIAILAAVLIPTFSNLVKKANVTADTQLVRNLNTALAVDNQEHPTMQSALDAAEKGGFDVGKISSKISENEILWDSVNDCFVYKTESGIEYIPNSKKTTEEVKDYQFWQIVDELPSTQKYSIYAGTGWTAETVDNLTVGFDAGENTEITEVKYVRSADATPQSVTIRMNGGKLTTNAPADTVAKYGYIEEDNIIAVAGNSSHQFGSVDLILITKGRVVFHVNESVDRVFVKGDEAIIAAVEGVTAPIPTPAPGVTTYKLQTVEPQSNNKIDETIVTIAEDGTVTTETKNAAGETIEAPSGFDLEEVKASAAAPVTEEQIKAESLPYAIDSKEALQAFLASDYKKGRLTASLLNIGSVTINRDVCIDGNGYKVIGTSSFSVSNTTSDVTLKNIYFEYIHNEKNKPDYAFDRYDIDEKYAEGNLSAIYASGLKNKLTVTGCTFDNIDWDALQLTPASGATIVITNNTFKHTAANMAQIRYIHIQASSSSTPATVNITGNKFYKTVNTEATAITNIGCWYVKPSENSDFTRNYFEYDPSSGMIETNSVVSTSGSFQQDGFRKLFPARDASGAEVNPAAFQKTEIAYMTLQDCINNAKATEYIYLVHDNTSSVTIPEGASRKIRLDGMKLGNLVNNGTLTFDNGSSTPGSANITNNGTLNLSCNEATGFKVVNNGVLNITYCSSSVAYNQSNITNNAGGQVKVTANKAYFTAPIDPEWTSWAGLAFYKSALQSNGYYAYVPYSDEEAMAEGAVVRYNSATNSARKYFTSLQEGVQGQAVYLLKDISENVTRIDGNISFYGEDFTYTGSLSSSANVNIYNGTAVLDNVNGVNLTFGSSQNTKGLTVTVKDGTVTGNITIYNNKTGGTTVVIEGGTYAGTITVKTGASLTIKGGTFSVDVSDYVAAGKTCTGSDTNGDGVDDTWVVE